ncbi:MAG: DUF2497 domain-containing protein [Pseudomonadota bacterium]
MAETNSEQEPTMEEILASIRRIINEDDEPGDKPEEPTAPEPVAEAQPEPVVEDVAPEPEPEPAPEVDEGVLELTERVEDDAAGTDPLAVADDLMIVDREDEIAPEPEPEPAPEPEAEPMFAAEPEPEPEPAPEPAPVVDEDSLLDETAAGAAAGMFAALSDNLRVSSDQGQTLEGIVRELLRPMLKQWLDENLPTIVEEKVEAEIERVARRRR